jgi:beta-lactamase regulating signal transducer with metallopeptidase domain
MDVLTDYAASGHFLIHTLELLVKITVVLASVWLLCFLFKASSAALKRMLWLSAILAVIFLPLAPSLLPPLRVPVSLSIFQADLNNTDNTKADNANAQFFEDGDSALKSLDFDRLFNTGRPFVQTESRAFAKNGAGQPWLTIALPLLLLCWAGGAIVFFIKLSRSLFRVNRLLREVENFSTLTDYQANCANVTTTIPVPILICDDISTPLAVGLLKPAILLPTDCVNWSQAKRQAAVLHEYAHIRHYDNLARLLAYVAAALYWFHPLVWLSTRKLIEEQEKAADDYVITQGISPSAYAQSLMEIVQSMQGRETNSPVFANMASYNFFPQRMRSLLKDQPSRRSLSRGKVSLVLVLTLLLVSPLALVTTQSSNSNPNDNEKIAQDALENKGDGLNKALEVATSATFELFYEQFDAMNQTLQTFKDRDVALADAINKRSVEEAKSYYIDAPVRMLAENNQTVNEFAETSIQTLFQTLTRLDAKYRLHPQSVNVENDFAKTEGRYEIVSNQDDTVLIKGQYKHGYKKIDDQWLIASEAKSEEIASTNNRAARASARAQTSSPGQRVVSSSTSSSAVKYSPLHLAVRNANVGIVRALVENGAELNKPDPEGNLPIHIAVQVADSDIVELLVSHGADLLQVDQANNTPLHLAAMVAKPDIVKTLLNHGANVNVTNSEGLSPLDIAVMTGKPEIVELIINSGASVN